MNRSLTDWLAYLESLHPKGQAGIRLGLERVARVKAALNQRKTCPVIVVGGTNGKGSTCAVLEKIYSLAGYKVGLYTSPHLLDYTERIRLNGRPVEAASLCRAFEKVARAMDALPDCALTYFEFSTLAAWEVFNAEFDENSANSAALDLIILEVGLGGRLDAVAIYEADCAIVTGVALDHTDWLGATREAIGFEKAGIFSAGKPAFYADDDPPRSLLDHAAQIGADLRLIGRDFDAKLDTENPALWDFSHKNQTFSALPLPGLRGAFQRQNAATALAAVCELLPALPVAEETLRQALAETRLLGRFQIVQEKPLIIVDVAHNPQAMAGLASNLHALEKEGKTTAGEKALTGGKATTGKTIAVIGMLADKDIAGSLAPLIGCVDVWFFADLSLPRGALAEALVKSLKTAYLTPALKEELSKKASEKSKPALPAPIRSPLLPPLPPVFCFSSPEQAFKEAAKQAGENDKIVIAGSFHTVSAILRLMPI